MKTQVQTILFHRGVFINAAKPWDSFTPEKCEQQGYNDPRYSIQRLTYYLRRFTQVNHELCS